MNTKIIFVSALIFQHVACKSQTDSIAPYSWRDSVPEELPVVSMNDPDNLNATDQQDVSGFLQSAKDPFQLTANFQFSSVGFRIKGLDNQCQHVFINGVKMNSIESNTAPWSHWSGLNDVLRFPVTRYGTSPNRDGSSGAGGFVNFESHASLNKKNLRFTLSAGNRVYNSRVMVTGSSGQTKKGWATTFSYSHRFGEWMWMQGTNYNAHAGYFSADKKLNERTTIGLTTFCTFINKCGTSPATREALELAGSRYYNSQWGFQNDVPRNANENSAVNCIAQLLYILKFRKSGSLTTTLHLNTSQSAAGGLNWNGAPNPRPDYYKNLPYALRSNGNEAGAELVKQNWMNDIRYRQINFDKLISANRSNIFALPGEGTVTDQTRAKYILESRIDRVTNVCLNAIYKYRMKNFFLAAGTTQQQQISRHYKVIDDLLGATYWLDYDQFAENLGVDDQVKQNNIDYPDRKIFRDDIFGYDYFICTTQSEWWVQIEHAARKLETYFCATFLARDQWWEGLVANGKFPETSKGKSAHVTAVCPGFKAGGVYKLTGRHFLNFNAAYISQPHSASTNFISPTTRNEQSPGEHKDYTYCGDVNYEIRYPGFRMKLGIYALQSFNQQRTRVYWHDLYGTNVNMLLSQVSIQSTGIELGIEKIINTRHVFNLALGISRAVYNNRPVIAMYQDNTGTPLYAGRTSYLRNFRLGGFPQTAYGAGYRFNSPKKWFVSADVSFFNDAYVDPNPDRRTAEALEKFMDSEVGKVAPIVEQTRLPASMIVNASAGISSRLRRRYNITVSVSSSNIFNDTNIISSSTESMRWDVNDLMKFGNRYTYLPGITFLLNTTLAF